MGWLSSYVLTFRNRFRNFLQKQRSEAHPSLDKNCVVVVFGAYNKMYTKNDIYDVDIPPNDGFVIPSGGDISTWQILDKVYRQWWKHLGLVLHSRRPCGADISSKILLNHDRKKDSDPLLLKFSVFFCVTGVTGEKRMWLVRQYTSTFHRCI